MINLENVIYVIADSNCNCYRKNVCGLKYIISIEPTLVRAGGLVVMARFCIFIELKDYMDTWIQPAFRRRTNK